MQEAFIIEFLILSLFFLAFSPSPLSNIFVTHSVGKRKREIVQWTSGVEEGAAAEAAGAAAAVGAIATASSTSIPSSSSPRREGGEGAAEKDVSLEQQHPYHNYQQLQLQQQQQQQQQQEGWVARGRKNRGGSKKNKQSRAFPACLSGCAWVKKEGGGEEA